MSDFCKTNLQTKARGGDVSQAVSLLSQLGAAHAFIKASASPPASNVDIEAAVKLIEHKVLVLEGVAGIGKSFAINAIRNELTRRKAMSLRGKLAEIEKLLAKWPSVTEEEVNAVVTLVSYCEVPVTLILLHPSSAYEDVIGGIRLLDGECTWLPGALTIACEKAQDAQRDQPAEAYHLVVLDELNRCNVPSVLGEAMLTIESSRRIGRAEAARASLPVGLAQDAWLATGRAVRVPSSRSMLGHTAYDERVKDDGCYSLWLPDNLLVLGTSNSSDRSILGFDQALRRRLPPMRLEPYSVPMWLNMLTRMEEGTPGSGDANRWHALWEILEWAHLNVLLRAVLGPDAMIGHSYFFSALNHFSKGTHEFKAALSDAWQFGILPQIIHSAEAYRSEDFIESLFHGPVKLRGATEADKLTPLRSSLVALGLPVSRLFVSECEAKGVTTWSMCRRHTIEQVGQQHAARLLITPLDRNTTLDVVPEYAEALHTHLLGTVGGTVPDWLRTTSLDVVSRDVSPDSGADAKKSAQGA